MRIVDSTRYGCTFSCPRKRYWFTEYKGRGIQLATPSEPLLYGTAVHTGCEHMAGGMDFVSAYALATMELMKIDPTILTVDGLSHKEELLALLWGHLRVYAEYILPNLKERFNFLAVEQEIAIPLDEDITYCTRLDDILDDKKTALNYNLNYKTSSYVNDLQNDMAHSMQLMMEAEAARLHLGIAAVGTIVIAFDKGRSYGASEAEKKRGLTGKRLLSPLTYLYAKGDDPWDVMTKYCTEYKTGWKRVPTFVPPLSPEIVWNGMLTPGDKQALFSELTPIYFDRGMVEDVRIQIVVSERQVVEMNEKTCFPQNFHNCFQDNGYLHHSCPYTPLCWDDEDPEMLLGGLYEWREYNHPQMLLGSLYEWREYNHPLEETVREAKEEV